MSLQLASLLLCGLLWGGTNPLIKRGAAVAEEGPGASLTPPRHSRHALTAAAPSATHRQSSVPFV